MDKSFRTAVMAVFVNDENKVLIGSSPRDGGFKFPQGGLNKGENSLDGLKREVKEELGLDLDDEDILEEHSEKVWYHYPDNSIYQENYIGQEQVVFKIRYHSEMIIVPQDDEFDSLIWIYPKDIEHYDTQYRTEAYKKALELCNLI